MSQQKIQSEHKDNRTVSIFNYNYKPAKSYDISIYDFVNILNKIASSKNAIDICRSINLKDPILRSHSLVYTLTYKCVFKGESSSYSAKEALNMLKCNAKPVFNEKTILLITTIKWKIFEQTQKQNFDNETAEWIGILAGLMLYFDELDENNYNQTAFLQDACTSLITEDL